LNDIQTILSHIVSNTPNTITNLFSSKQNKHARLEILARTHLANTPKHGYCDAGKDEGITAPWTQAYPARRDSYSVSLSQLDVGSTC